MYRAKSVRSDGSLGLGAIHSNSTNTRSTWAQVGLCQLGFIRKSSNNQIRSKWLELASVSLSSLERARTIKLNYWESLGKNFSDPAFQEDNKIRLYARSTCLELLELFEMSRNGSSYIGIKFNFWESARDKNFSHTKLFAVSNCSLGSGKEIKCIIRRTR